MPLPTVLNGVPDHEWPKKMFYAVYLLFVLSAYLCLIYIVGDDLFFILNIFMFRGRYAMITDILSLLNYEGDRDRKKDKRILKDSYSMQLELNG